MNVQEQKRCAVEQHSRQASEFAERYRVMDEDPYRSCFTYSRRRLEHALEPLLPQDGAGRRLLDVGCGTGHQMAALRDRGYVVAGVDGSAEMLVEARARNPEADVRQSDVEALPFRDASFDFILCIEVLRYLPDPLPCLREMARVLKPGGVCLATAAPLLNSNGYWLVNRLAGLLPTRRLVRLKQFFTTSGRARRNFRAAGFDVVDVHGVYLGPINWIERLFPWGLRPLLRAWEPLDARLADRAVLREFSNMFLIRAVKSTAGGR